MTESKADDADIQLYLMLCHARDTTLSRDEADRLREMLRSSAAARAGYRRFIALEACLRQESLLEQGAAEGEQGEAEGATDGACAGGSRTEAATRHEQHAQPAIFDEELSSARLLRWMATHPRRASLVAAGLVLSLFLAVMALITPPFYRALTGGGQQQADQGDAALEGAGHNRIVAELTGEFEAAWAAGTLAPHRGAFLRAGRNLDLESGFAEVTFANGSRVLLEGPARFETTDADTARLRRGKLVASVGPEAEGFTVLTPQLSIMDLGTEFAVAVDEHGVNEVHVFQGRVHCEAVKFQRDLVAGEALRFDPAAVAAEIEAARPQKFTQQLPRTRVLVAGDIRYVDAAPLDARRDALAEAAHAFIYPERLDWELPAPLELDVSTAGKADHRSRSPKALPAGAEVDVYLLHLDPPETDVLTARGKIVFDRPIQGVIFTGERLAASEAQLRLAPARPPLEDEAVIGMTGPDQLSICDKRTALVFELTAGQALDQIRIVVDSAKADTSKADGGRQK